jgi:hypothetical protein
LLLLHSTGLPEKYKERFAALEEENSFLYNVYSYKDIKAKFIEFFDNVSLSFRVDNDDAMPKDFIARLRPYLAQEFAGHVISMPNVQVIQRVGADSFLREIHYYPCNALGLAYVTDKKYQHIHELGGHDGIKQRFPVICLPAGEGVQTLNGKNVINDFWEGVPRLTWNQNELKKFLEGVGYPNFDLSCLDVVPRRKTDFQHRHLRNFDLSCLDVVPLSDA